MEHLELNKVACYSNSFDPPMVQYVGDEELQELLKATNTAKLPVAIFVNGKLHTKGPLSQEVIDKITLKLHYEVN